ncbi:MAG: DUF2079 domain-containing protein [Elusimicrobia bacterium]|nr:DUF2079 domain-containing protein [Elusimicrobiota bacterium]
MGVKAAQYATFQLQVDTGIHGNIAWNLAHGNGLISSVYGEYNYLGIRFALTGALLGPLLWVWPNVMALVLTQAAAVGSTILGIYLLGRRHCRGLTAAWALALLVWANPFFHDIAASFLDSNQLALPLFIWGAYLFESRRVPAAAVCAVLFMLTREQAPFVFLGVGLLVLRLGRGRKQKLAGAGIAGSSILCWLAMLAIERRVREAYGMPEMVLWKQYYPSFGSTSAEVMQTLLYRPWIVGTSLFYPFAKMLVPARVILSLALLPLAAGVYFLPALMAWLPQQMSDDFAFQHMVWGHYAAMVAGPLFWACAHGLRRLLDFRGRQSRAIAWVLLVSSVCFFASSSFLPGEEARIVGTWGDSLRLAMRTVPPQAKVWSDGLLVPYFCMRRYVRNLPDTAQDEFFEKNLFAPDRVILTRRWLALAGRFTRSRVTEFLTERRFTVVYRDENLLVLADPTAPSDCSEPVQRTSLPSPPAQ